MAIAIVTLGAYACGVSSAVARSSARCQLTNGSHVFTVSIERDRKTKGRVGNAYVVSRKGLVYVFAGAGGNRVQCSGASPTTSNIKSIQVIAAPGLKAAALTVDERGGLFTHGSGDEQDGSSEIEFDINLGPRSVVSFLMTAGRRLS
jgi:hypothetical protein